MKIRDFVLIVFPLAVLLSCSSSTGPDKQSGYKLTELHFETELPCIVNIMFQVTDMRDNGIADLMTDDFMIYEDGDAYSPTESFPIIRKREHIPYSLKTVLLIDNSASVGANLSEIESAAISLVSNISSKQEFAIFKFSETTTLIQDFTDNIDDLTDAINSIQLGYATTDLYGAIITGVTKLNEYYGLDSIQQAYLIALTDGSDTQHLHTLSEALTARGDMSVFTVGLGAEIEPDVLRSLGNAGFYHLDDVSELADKFADIQNSIVSWANSFYWLNYMSPTRGNVNHVLELKIIGNDNHGSSGHISEEFNSYGFYSVLQGIYINATEAEPYGIDTIRIERYRTATLEAVTYLADDLPEYTWNSTDESVVTLEINDRDNSIAYATAVGDTGQTAKIIVRDMTNDLSDTINVIISNPVMPVEGGTFMMGSNFWDNTTPVHEVNISSFYMGKHEVTQREWFHIMGENPSCYVYGDSADFSDDEGNLPVSNITWGEALLYCNLRSIAEGFTPCYIISDEDTTCDFNASGYRLPTEAEWEFAARGGNLSAGYTYSGSNSIGDVAWYSYNSGGHLQDIAGKTPNELGIYDMSGNVLEFCWDRYGEDYYSVSPDTDPRGPSGGSSVVVRGGAYSTNSTNCHVAYRSSEIDSAKRCYLGFRVCRTAVK